jgi:hypothetical protein
MRAVAIALGLASSAAAHAKNHIVATDTGSPVYHYAQLTADACYAELDARHIAYEKAEARGVLAPVRLGAPLHGVTYRSEASAAARATSPYEITDCRLVLALDDFAAILEQHGIVEVRHYSIYRPPANKWPEDKIAGQHNGALALDAGKFVTGDRTVLSVDRDFHGAIGAVTCGPKAHPRVASPAATELRAILCEAVDAKLFNVVLTPNHNRPHHNHFHLEVMAGVAWFLVD